MKFAGKARMYGAVSSAGLVGLFAVLTMFGSLIDIPFRPWQPITMQLFFVLLSGALIGKRRGAISQGLYAVLGLAGVPYFDRFAYSFPQPNLFLNPFFRRSWLKLGYLIGFVGAAYIAGKSVDIRDTDVVRFILTSVAATVLVYVSAIVYFVFVAGRIRLVFWEGLLSHAGFNLIEAVLAGFVIYRLRRADLL